MSTRSGGAGHHVLAIHGGVGTLPTAKMTAELERSYRSALGESLLAGHAILREGGAAMDAVVASVRVMEDSPLFNAGRGSNFDERGVVAMDASVMDGTTLAAGAVAGVTDVRNPVELARLVMDRSEHVMLVAEGAERFARLQGLEATDPSWFHTDGRRDALERARKERSERGRDVRPNVLGDRSGTVGAVALDASGRLAAATSTGGMAAKTWGRVGDSPIIGAGTWASPLCAVSCTGWGEYFIRNAAAHDVHARMAYAGASLAEAVDGVIFGTLERQVPGSGGMIAVDAEGHVELRFNTPGMYRGRIGRDGEPELAIYEERPARGGQRE